MVLAGTEKRLYNRTEKHKQNVLDYQKWSLWLKAETTYLQSQAFQIQVNRADNTGKPGSSREAGCENVI